MNKIGLIILLIFSTAYNIFGQESFDVFLKKFPFKTLTKYESKNILKLELSNPDEKIQAGQILISPNNFYGLTVLRTCKTSPICEIMTFFTFSKNGLLIDSRIFASKFGDCGFSDIKEPELITDTLLVIREHNKVIDCKKGEITNQELYMNYYHIDSNGNFIDGKRTLIDLRRKYYYASTTLLSKRDLKKLPKKELQVMRNEIFASYGHQFHNKEWIDYFTSQIWYVPKGYEIKLNQLSAIEIENLSLLQELEGDLN